MNNIDYIKVSLKKTESNIIVLKFKGEIPGCYPGISLFIYCPRSQVVLGNAH